MEHQDTAFWLALEAVFGAAIIIGTDPEHLKRTAQAITIELNGISYAGKAIQIIESASMMRHLGVQE